MPIRFSTALRIVAYVCGRCKKGDRRLKRPYGQVAPLLCFDCQGTYRGPLYLIPAIPGELGGDGSIQAFYSPDDAPPDAWSWWFGLPHRPRPWPRR